MPNKKKYLEGFLHVLNKNGIHTELLNDGLICVSGKRQIVIPGVGHLQFIEHAPLKLLALVQSKLGLNKRIFARNCEVKRIDRSVASDFLNRYHLMNSTQSAFNFGLMHNNELISVASFSKGRKMDRLPEDKRSYELIRFCCKEGITVTGGLTKLVKNFCREKNAGDVMTYVDKQLSEGSSFIRAGFVKHSETERNVKLVYTP